MLSPRFAGWGVLFTGKSRNQEAVGLSMNWLQICLFGSFFSSFLSHRYEPANELKTVLNSPNFRFSPYSPTAS